jgi:hypothetical protein
LLETQESRRLWLQRLEGKIDRGLQSLKRRKGIDGEVFFEELHHKRE